MNDQNLNISDVKAKQLTIAPRQINIGARGDAVRGWTEALVRGPLQQCGQVERARDAEEAAEEGRHEDAAGGYLAIAVALEDADFGAAASRYRQRAADALAQAGREDEAYRIRLSLAREYLEDGEMTALIHARNAAELASSERAWEAEGMKARASWPEQEEGDVESLRRAREVSRGTADEAEWAAALVELQVLNGDEAEQALAVANEVADQMPLTPGPRLTLELDRLDLLADLGFDEEAEAGWRDLLVWASEPDLPLPDVARVYQRRGIARAHAGDHEGARKAQMQAITTWSRHQDYNDQLAEAYFSAGSISLALGDQSAAFDDAIPLARSLRGRVETDTSHCERLLRRGYRALTEERANDALRCFATAFNISRRAGNFSDFLQASDGLGDVLAFAQRPTHALSAYVQAGKPDKAARVGSRLSVDQILDVVSVEGARWERAAAWAAVAAAGRVASDEAAAVLAAAALKEIEREAPFGFPINVSFYAADALANVICAVPEGLLEDSLAALRERLRIRAGDPRRLSQPLLLISLCGRADELESVIEAMLADDLQVSHPADALEPLLRERPELRRHLLDEAAAGNDLALEFLVFTDFFDEDQRLRERAREKVLAATASEFRTVEREGPTTTVSYGIGINLAPIGRFALYSDPEERRAFVTSLLAQLTDPDPKLPIMSRVGAVEALHNLSPAMPEEMVAEVAAALLARAAREDQPAEWDRVGVDDPLARFTVNMAPRDALQTAALQALSVLAKHRPEAKDLLLQALPVAIASGAESPLAAALQALGRDPQIHLSGMRLQAFLTHESDSVRLAALEALHEREGEEALDHARAMISDPSPRIRTRLIGIASENDGGRELIELLTEDPDSYTRAMVRVALAKAEYFFLS
jgi:tetratricopeptide (TPR) repeat protein